MSVELDLVERDVELRELGAALDRCFDGAGSALVVSGPAGIGKTRLLSELEAQAGARGAQVLSARGTEMERGFGFGIVRQLFRRAIGSLDAGGRDGVFAGAAALAASVLGFAETGAIGTAADESSLYGLFWLVVNLSQRTPIVLAIDDAHWADAPSLGFVRYLSRRLEGMPVLVGLAARPAEPGAEAEMLRELVDELDPQRVAPSPLTEEGAAIVVRAELRTDASAALCAACHEATGGNPLLLTELLVHLQEDRPDPAATPAEAVAAMGPERVAAGVLARAEKLDAAAPDFVRAVSILGDGAELRDAAPLANIDLNHAATVADGLAAAGILGSAQTMRFVHPVIRTSVYEGMTPAMRGASHARAAALLAARDAPAESVAAHLLVSEPTGDPDVVTALDQAAREAAGRGASASAALYLRRAIAESPNARVRAELLHDLGRAEVRLREPASVGHLQEAAALTDDRERKLQITLELLDVLIIAGQWEASVETIEVAIEEFAGEDLPEQLDLEALRAAHRLYDPRTIGAFDREYPRLREIVAGRTDEDSQRLRWLLAANASLRGEPATAVLELCRPGPSGPTYMRNGRESTLIVQGMSALLGVDAFEQVEALADAVRIESRRRGSVLGTLTAMGYTAALSERRGDLTAAAAEMRGLVDVLRLNDMGLMAVTSFVHLLLDTILERPELDDLAEIGATIELPPPFDITVTGAMMCEARGAIRAMRGERDVVADLRAAEAIYDQLVISPRFTPWRSRLALALPDSERDDALRLATEELELARSAESARAEGVSLRTLGLLAYDDGEELLRRSVDVLADSPSMLEQARSQAELGAAIRRRKRRTEARDHLRIAADLAQRCGAQRLEIRILEEMRIAGGKPRRRSISGRDSLTPSERRVADAAAGGATNREIAQSLFVTPRTVEMHLSNSYRKLGIATRGELATALAEPVPIA